MRQQGDDAEMDTVRPSPGSSTAAPVEDCCVGLPVPPNLMSDTSGPPVGPPGLGCEEVRSDHPLQSGDAEARPEAEEEGPGQREAKSRKVCHEAVIWGTGAVPDEAARSDASESHWQQRQRQREAEEHSAAAEDAARGSYAPDGGAARRRRDEEEVGRSFNSNTSMPADTQNAVRRGKARQGPCVFGCTHSAKRNRAGEQVWAVTSSPSPWPQVPVGATLCSKHYEQGKTLLRRGLHNSVGESAPVQCAERPASASNPAVGNTAQCADSRGVGEAANNAAVHEFFACTRVCAEQTNVLEKTQNSPAGGERGSGEPELSLKRQFVTRGECIATGCHAKTHRTDQPCPRGVKTSQSDKLEHDTRNSFGSSTSDCPETVHFPSTERTDVVRLWDTNGCAAVLAHS